MQQGTSSTASMQQGTSSCELISATRKHGSAGGNWAVRYDVHFLPLYFA